MIRAVLMAGGGSRRMRATEGPGHKCLIEVLGVPILERNIAYLLSSGFTDLVAVTSVHEPALMEFLESRGRALAVARGAHLECTIEHEPLGTIGVVQALAGSTGSLLVLAADNLTALDLRNLVEHHRRAGAAMTVATHEQPFPIPWGEVEVAGGRIRRYMEKPVRRIPISSGIYVVDASAAKLIAPGTRCDTPELIERLLARHLVVSAFTHDGPWIDINEASALHDAARLVTSHAERFNLWACAPDREVAGLLARESDRILIERRDGDAQRYPGLWDLPGIWIDRASRRDAVERALVPLFKPISPVEALAVFDDLDAQTRQLIRHHVFVAGVQRPPGGGGTYDWLSLRAGAARSSLSPPLRRAIAHLESAS